MSNQQRRSQASPRRRRSSGPDATPYPPPNQYASPNYSPQYASQGYGQHPPQPYGQAPYGYQYNSPHTPQFGNYPGAAPQNPAYGYPPNDGVGYSPNYPYQGGLNSQRPPSPPRDRRRPPSPGYPPAPYLPYGQRPPSPHRQPSPHRPPSPYRPPSPGYTAQTFQSPNDVHELLDYVERVNAVANKYRLEADFHQCELESLRRQFEVEKARGEEWIQFENDAAALAAVKVAPFRAQSEEALLQLKLDRERFGALRAATVNICRPAC